VIRPSSQSASITFPYSHSSKVADPEYHRRVLTVNPNTMRLEFRYASRPVLMVCRVIFENGFEEAAEFGEPLVFLDLTFDETPGQTDHFEKHTMEVRQVPSRRRMVWHGRPFQSYIERTGKCCGPVPIWKGIPECLLRPRSMRWATVTKFDGAQLGILVMCSPIVDIRVQISSRCRKSTSLMPIKWVAKERI
jgi:hypothetical protein